MTWTGITTNLASTNLMTFLEGNGAINPRFYRVGLLPNP